MKKKIIIIIIFILILIPISNRLKDGGSIEYKAILYQYTKIHRLNNNLPTGYEEFNSDLLKQFAEVSISLENLLKY